MSGMALPSKKQQIATVAGFLDADRNEGRSLEEIATDIVEGYLDALLKGIQKPASPLRAGQLLKSPIDNKVRRVAWLNDERGRVWVVGETSSYGWLSSTEVRLWEFCEDFRPKKRIDGKMVEMTDEMIAEAWSNPKFQVGEKLSQRQRQFVYQIIAVGPQCVLMEDAKTGELQVDSNANLEKYYKKEVKGAAEW